MNKKALISLMLGVIISAVALFFAFRNVPFNDLLLYAGSINYIWSLPAVSIAMFAFVLRAARWQVILASTREISFWSAFHPMMIGFMINCILPGRAGEVARPVILKKSENIPFSTGIATVAAERAFDISFILIFFIIVLATVDIDPKLDMTFGEYHLSRKTLIDISEGFLKICLFLIAGIVFVSIRKTRESMKRIIATIPSIFFFAGTELKKKILTKVCNPLINLLDNFASGFSLIKSPKKLIVCAGLSFLIWILSAFSYYIMAQGCPGIGLSFVEISAVMIIVCFFIALPSIPGWWGIWEAGGIFALSLFGISTKEAAGFTLVNHAIQVFPVIILGVLSALKTGMNIMQVTYDDK